MVWQAARVTATGTEARARTVVNLSSNGAVNYKRT